LKGDYLRNPEFIGRFPSFCEFFNFQHFPLLHSALILNFPIFIIALAKLIEFVCCYVQLNHHLILPQLKAVSCQQQLQNLKNLLKAFFLSPVSK
jgi:hypothetical protein